MVYFVKWWYLYYFRLQAHLGRRNQVRLPFNLNIFYKMLFSCNLKHNAKSFVWVEIAQVVRAHSSSFSEHLALENGQLILILSKNASGWWLGELQVSVDCCSVESNVIHLILTHCFFTCGSSAFKARVMKLVLGDLNPLSCRRIYTFFLASLPST